MGEVREMMKISPIILFLLLFGIYGCYANKDNVSQQKFEEIRDNIGDKDIINIGMIVDMGSLLGKVVRTCITMAVTDFYNENSHYKTRIALHTRDSTGDSLHSIVVALDLLETFKVHALIVPIISNEELFMARLVDKATVPLLSFSSIPSLDAHPYFLQVAGDEATQFLGIAALSKSFKWKSLVVFYEDTVDSRQVQPFLYNILQENHIHVTYQTAISLTATDDQIVVELHKLIKMKISIVIVHMSISLASRIFVNAKMLGLMSNGFAWIVTSKTMNLLDFEDSSVVETMQGVIGFRSYISPSNKLHSFTLRWRREFLITESIMDIRELNMYGVWAYDAIWALAEAMERVGVKPPPHGFQCKLLNLSCSKVSDNGLALLSQISNSKFIGLAGDFELLNHKLVHEAHEIVNVIGKNERTVGFWTSAHGLAKEIYPANKISLNSSLETIIWPGISISTPVSHSVHISGKSLRVGIPWGRRRPELVTWQFDRQRNATTSDWLGYNMSFEFIPFNGTYNDLVYQVFLKKYDVAVGDITILSNRSEHVDFTPPFTEFGVGMVAKVRDNKNHWFFLEPLDPYLWLMSACMFVVTGVIVWLIEHPINEEFKGSMAQQVGTILWFAVSTLVFAHKERLKSNLSRFVVGVWLFVVLILTSSYTASLSSLLTVRSFKLRKDDYIGSANPLVEGLPVNNLNFGDSRLKPYQSVEGYDEALRKGSKKGGAGAIIDEMPYIKIFLAKFPHDYTMIKTSATTNGFGFAFPKGSPLVHEISRAIAGLREEGKLMQMENKWFTGQSLPLLSQETQQATTVYTLSINNFLGLFLLSGISKMIAILTILIFLLRERLSKTYLMFKLWLLQRLMFKLRFIPPQPEIAVAG